MTATQYQMVQSGNFAKWLDLLHSEHKFVETGFQFEFLDPTVENAISMLRSSNITVFVNECFEASLRLMEDYYSLRPGAANAFLYSSHLKLNTGAYDETQPERNQLAKLRERSKAYFPNEYMFYDAAVEQFKHQLSISKAISPQLMHECLETILK
jgi:hypothetical protein